MEDYTTNNEAGAANPFARTGLVRTPPSQTQPVQGQEKEHQQMQQQQQQQQQYSAWSRGPKLPRVVAAKKLIDELHEYVDKRSNVHKDIKALVIKIQGTLGSAVKDALFDATWKNKAEQNETSFFLTLETLFQSLTKYKKSALLGS
nr:probable C-terminal domain small phosphatase [Aedes albopictus]